jgi:MFS family permease
MMGALESGERLSDCPGYWRLWTASTVSGLGSYVTNLAIGVLIVLTLHGGATEVGLVNAARWIPYLLFGLVAGVLVDRARRRPLLVVTDLGRGILLIAVPVLSAIHQLHVVWLMGLMAVFGLMSLVNDAAFQAFVPRLVPPSLLTSAHARLDQSDAVAQASGPAMAGGLVSLVGAPVAVLVDAVSYLVSAVLLWSVTVTEPAPRQLSVRGVRGEAVEGLRWVYQHATLRALAMSTHAWFFFSAVTGATLIPFALRTLHLNAFGLGLALAAAGAGGLLGSLVAVRLGMRFGAGRVVIACRAATALAWALVALSPDHLAGWLLFGAGQFILGLSLGAENANEMGYRQTVTPDRLQGRMNATMRSINRAMIVIGAPLGGLLGDKIGYRSMLWIASLGFLAVATTLGLSRFRNARLDDAHVNPL